MKSSFDSMKELNDSMKKQVCKTNTGFPRVMEFLEYHGILKGLFQTLKVREFCIFVQVMEYQGFLFVSLNFSFHLSKCNFSIAHFFYCVVSRVLRIVMVRQFFSGILFPSRSST